MFYIYFFGLAVLIRFIHYGSKISMPKGIVGNTEDVKRPVKQQPGTRCRLYCAVAFRADQPTHLSVVQGLSKVQCRRNVPSPFEAFISYILLPFLLMYWREKIQGSKKERPRTPPNGLSIIPRLVSSGAVNSLGEISKLIALFHTESKIRAKVNEASVSQDVYKFLFGNPYRWRPIRYIKLRGRSPRPNYTDRETAACRQS
jgi:hypothetical protein